MTPSLAKLGLFAKWPRPGDVKTRLAAATSPEWAARVALAFLQDTIRRLVTVEARRVLAYAPTDARQDFARLVGDRFELMPQADGDLGQRMAAFVTAALAEGAERIVLVGTDSPTLPVEYVATALEELQRVDVVLGPATDGGYYLLGCARGLPPIFEGIAWGGSRVLAETVERVSAAGLRLALLPPWYDVDTLPDWHLLCGHIMALRAARKEPGVPHTEALLGSGAPE